VARAGPQAAGAGRRLEARASEEEHRREERRLRRERADARARQRRYIRSLREARQGEEEVRATLRYGYEHIVGAGGRMGAILRSLDRVVPTDLPLLLLGETGTGKELVARAIHEHSPRRGGPFVTVNAAALPESLVESELFGYRRGAYTGADRDRMGRIREADRGTFFLDEIGEMTTSAQAKLLRVLETATVRPVGGGSDHPIDVRLITATNRDLQASVEEGRFREDLYHRVRVVPIELPALRERLDDLPLLVEHFLLAHSRGAPPAVSEEAVAHLRTHAWPGNIRELEMCLRVALVLCDGPRLLRKHIRIHPVSGPSTGSDRVRLDGLSQRQRRLLEEWPEAEAISCSSYVKRFGLSPRTASRDLADLMTRGLLERRGAGAATRYVRVVNP
jgi:transcriptional regulator with PAS, ATPase and Fis domain